jgi:hypothetical protein
MNKHELEIIVDEWSNVAKGSKTVPLVSLGTNDNAIKQERKVFEYCAKVLKGIINKKDDTSNS